MKHVTLLFVILTASTSAFALETVATFPADKDGTSQNIRVVEFNIAPDEDFHGTIIDIAAETPEQSIEAPVRIQFYDAAKGFRGSGPSRAPAPFTPGKHYHVKVMLNLPAATYDVWLTPLAEAPKEVLEPTKRVVLLPAG